MRSAIAWITRKRVNSKRANCIGVTGGFFCVEKFVTPYTNEKGVCPWSTQEKNEITTPATGA